MDLKQSDESDDEEFELNSTYSPWPLGAVPTSWQRPELGELRKLGFRLNDPRDAVQIFEEQIAEYAGCKYAVAVDSCTSGIFLALKYRNYLGKIFIPRQTYVSVPMQVIHCGAKLVPRADPWTGLYSIDPVDVVDSAARFTSNMYVGNGALQVLSFQIKKRLPIGKGGMILTNDKDARDWLRLARHDGRNLNTPYTASKHVNLVGWHMYMTPEDAARGLLVFGQLDSNLPDMMTFSHYPDWTEWPVFKPFIT